MQSLAVNLKYNCSLLFTLFIGSQYFLFVLSIETGNNNIFYSVKIL